MDRKYILAQPLTTNLQKQLLSGWCLGTLTDKITEMSPTEGVKMYQSTIQSCLKRHSSRVQNIGVFSSIHAQLKYTTSTVCLHQNNSTIEGLVKKAYLLFSFDVNIPMFLACQDTVKKGITHYILHYFPDSRANLLGILEM